MSAALAVAAGYFALATIGTVLSVPPSGFAIIWPATAFLIAVLLLTPSRLWWMYAVTVAPTHFLMNWTFEPSALVVTFTQIAGNFALAIATALALRATSGKLLDFADFRTMLRFVFVAGIAVPAVVNSLILLVHLATGKTTDFWLSWRQWMVAGVFPTVTIPPVLIQAVSCIGARSFNRAWILETTLVSLGVFAVGLFAYRSGLAEEWEPFVRLLPIPLLLWAGVRLGAGGSAVSLLSLAGAIVTRALRGEGPFAEGSSASDIIALQSYLIAISVPLMLLSALMQERRRTEDLLRRSEERMAVVAASTDTGLWQWDERQKKLWLTDHCRSMFGIGANVEVTPPMILGAVHPDDRAPVARALRATLGSAGSAQREFRVQHPDGGVRWFTVKTHTTFDQENRPLLVSGLFKDVTQRVGSQDDAERLTRRLLTLQDDERRAIARELHDFTAQHLVAADLSLGAARRLPELSDEPRRLLDAVASSIREALKELRTFAFLLQPPELENEKLSDVLHRYVDGFGRRTGLKTSLRVSPLADSLPPEQRRAILRIVQEGLANVDRHAGASNVVVHVRCVGGRLHLVINDNGRGAKRLFEGESGENVLGVSVPGIAARIRQLGGKIEVSNRAAGTTVHVAMPVGKATSLPPAA